MIAILTFFLVIVGSLLVTRVATVALMLTGMPRESARFQARSALTGAGYTTTEAESVVAHPARRKIVMSLMLLGSAGIVVAVVTLAISFVDASREDASWRVAWLIAGGLVLLLIARSHRVERGMRLVFRRLLRRYTDLDVRDYAGLLHLAEGYSVMRMHIDPEDWTANRSLGDLRLRDEGVAVLGIERRHGTYVGDPTDASLLRIGDTAIIYGRQHELEQLARRPAGEAGQRIHESAVALHADRVAARRGDRVLSALG
ncbi:MAG: potassium transporter TrkA [Thermoleophilia bacterium]|nr:potassium transporter TrkA [Thermoleophilia bacterium]MDH3725590.1 potassium transporter TrkA [Thermoleophilia bacterium]